MKKVIGLWCLILTGFSSVAQIDTSYFSNLKYRNIGPSRGGRSTAVVGDRNNTNLFYMGSTGGGVWKTENGGSSWQNISDGFFGGSIGSIAIANSDDNVIYVGQGEESLRGNVSAGNGIWKSEDAGKTWTFKGLAKSRHITRIAIDPNNSQKLFAAVLGDLYTDTEERGLYGSEDGGNTWKKLVHSNNAAGFNEVIIDPLNYRNVYASSWRVRRTAYSFSSGGEGSGLWKSKDGGKTWKNITTNKGLPTGTIGKITIAASAVQKDLVFAMVEHATKGGLYRSKDGGENWELMNSEGKIRQRAWYYSRIYTDTKDASTVYTTNVYFLKSTDGGATFHQINTPHVDHHDLWIDPQNANRMIVANDGGAQVSFNGGGNWSSYHNQPTEQFYRVITDNHVPYRIYGAQQDNSTMRVNHITGSWESTAGGESAHIAPYSEDNDIIFAGSYGGFLTMYNHQNRDVRAINVWPDNPMGYGAEGMKYRFQWNFPVFFSPHNPKRLYAASNHLHVSEDFGNSWKIISPDVTRNDSAKLVASGGPITKDNTGVEYYCTIFSAVESPLEKDVIWVGSDDGLLHITHDGGQNWRNIALKQIPKWSIINSIEVDPFVKGVAYIAATNYKAGDNKPYLLKVSGYGDKVELIVTGIPEESFTRAIRADKKRANLLYAGTERGMFISNNGGRSWQPFQLNLPEVPITDLEQKENDLIVATQGRGFWIIDNLDAVRIGNPQKLSTDLKLLGCENTYLIPHGHLSYSFFLADSLESTDTLVVEIKDDKGTVVRSFSNHKLGDNVLDINPNKGMNYNKWNLYHAAARLPKDMILWWANTQGPRAKPGTYTLKISLNEVSDSSSFDVLIDPNSDAKYEDYIAKYEFLSEVVSKIEETHKTLEDIKTIQSALGSFISTHELDKDDEIRLLSDSITNLLSDIQNVLYQTKNRSNQDPINFPIKLNNKLAHLNSLVQMGNFGPTEQAILVKNELIAQIDKQLLRFDDIKKNELQSFNALLHTRKVDLIEFKE